MSPQVWSPQVRAGVCDPELRRRRLQPGAAWNLVRSRREGRLHFLSGRGPRAVVVPYATTDTGLVIELPSYNDALPYLEGSVVDVEVSDQDADGRQWSVQVSGCPRPSSTNPSQSEVIRQWPSALSSRRFLINADQVNGTITVDVNPNTAH